MLLSPYCASGIIAMTIHDEEEYVLELVRAGVSGYVLKDISPVKLIILIILSLPHNSCLRGKNTV
jgi:DNA-binding NarL/FixJ family response regulator